MVFGDLRYWASRFIATEERILERIATIWPACIAMLPGQPEEDSITVNLVDLLWKDPEVRRICHWVDYQYEPFGISPSGAKYSKGKIDVAILLDWDREHYLAYECKRLCVAHGGRRQSLAKGYVRDGMMRFLTEQYAEGLPIGCMLGYVMDGDIGFAMQQLTKSVKGYSPLNLLSGPMVMKSVMSIPRLMTSHTRGSSVIELRHAFLGF